MERFCLGRETIFHNFLPDLHNNTDKLLNLEMLLIYLNFHYIFRNLILARQLFVFVILMAVIVQWLKLYLQLWESS